MILYSGGPCLLNHKTSGVICCQQDPGSSSGKANAVDAVEANRVFVPSQKGTAAGIKCGRLFVAIQAAKKSTKVDRFPRFQPKKEGEGDQAGKVSVELKKDAVTIGADGKEVTVEATTTGRGR